MKKVIVIGAGIKGLSISYCLKKNNPDSFDITIIEKNKAGIEAEFQKCGMIRPALTEEHAAHLKNNHIWQRKKGFDIGFLDGNELRELEPGLSGNILCGLYSKEDGQVNNRKLMDALITANKKLRNKIIEDIGVKDYLTEAINKKTKKITGVTTNNGIFDADIVVNAAGSWSSLISKGLIPNFKIRPVMGQMVSLHSDK